MTLEALTDYVRIKTPGWGPSNTEHMGLHLKPSTTDTTLMMPLRPGDVFWVGTSTLSIELEPVEESEEVQVTSSGHIGAVARATKDMDDLEDDDLEKPSILALEETEIFNLSTVSRHRNSTPVVPLSRESAILETPAFDRRHDLNLDPVTIMSSIDGNSTKEPSNLPDVLKELVPHPEATEAATQASARSEGAPSSILGGPMHEIPSHLADEGSPDQSPEPEVSHVNPNQEEDSLGSTIRVEIPLNKPIKSSRAKKRKVEDVNSSQEDSPEPSSSFRSTRSAGLGALSSSISTHSGIRILFANSTTIDKSIAYTKFLLKQGVRTVKSVVDCTILCVGKGKELKRTSKLILAVASGKEIVTDDWITQSATKGSLLDFKDYLVNDAEREFEWGTKLREAIERGRQGIKPFQGWTFHFTSSASKELGKGFAELKEIAVFAGATCIKAGLPRKGAEHDPSTVLIASSHDDKDLPALRGGDERAYSKDIITLSVLRGVLDTGSDEFLIDLKPQVEKSASRKRKR